MRVLLTHDPDALALYYGPRALAGLEALAEIRRHASPAPLAGEALIAAAEGCELIVSYRNTPAPAALFERLPDLVAFLRCAVDIRNVDVAAASRHGVLVTHAGPGFAAAVSELIVGLMIDLARGITAAASAYHRGQLPPARMGRQLAGSTLGVLGYGTIGRQLAGLAKALGMTVLVCDPGKQVEDPALRQVAMAELLAEADFVVCLVVATPATENLLDASALAQMRPSAWLINAARGNLVDESALAAALAAGRLAGAALDVGRAPDQLPTPALARLPNVIATPHIGGLTPAAVEAQALETVDQVAALLAGRVPRNAVNADAAHRLARLRPSAIASDRDG